MKHGGRTAAAAIAMACLGYAMLVACGGDETSGASTTTGADAATDGSTSNGDGGSGPGPGPGPSGPIDPDEAARAAVVLGSCVPDDGVHRYLEDIYLRRTNDPQTELVFRQAVHCLATTNTGCDAVKTCIGFEIDIVPDAGDCVRECTGNVRTSCDGRLRFREDCARHGEVCEQTDGGRPICIAPGFPPCPREDSGGYTPRCEDGKPTYCVGPYEKKGIDCAGEGLVCQSGRCQGTEGACTGDSFGGATVTWNQGISCDGTASLKACVGGGIATVACSSLVPSFTCQTITVDGGASSYCGLGAECTPPSRSNLQCDGDRVVVCNAGRLDMIDCKSLGFTTCNQDARGCVPNLATINGFVDGG